jgi:cytochrome c peroxidase
MFPVLSGDEMAGHYSENDVAQAVRQGFLTGENGAWAILSKRVADIPEYRAAFDSVIGAQTPLHFSDISNAIAAFIGFEWRADNSPFDQYLRDRTPLSDDAANGMALFYGKANCAGCHSGQFQTDHQFHAIAMPQIGPGKAARFESHHRDEGRARVTADLADLYRFRTPSLRNVTATAPYGHSGAFATLEGVVRHHLNPIKSLRSYDSSQAILPALEGSPDFTVMADAAEVDRIAGANALEPVSLSDSEIKELMAFLDALTDPVARLGVPLIVPSDLPVDQ